MTPKKIDDVLADSFMLMKHAPSGEARFFIDVWLATCEKFVGFCPQDNPETAKYDNRRKA